MKSLLFVILVIILIPDQCLSQRIVVIDSDSGEPIPFVTAKHGTVGYYSNAFGVIELQPIPKPANLKLTHISYSELEIQSSNISDTIKMLPKTIALPEVEIKSPAKKEIVIAPLKKAYNFSSCVLMPKSELLTFISSEKFKNRYIHKLTVPFVSSTEKLRRDTIHEFAVVRFNIYKSVEGMPGGKIYESQVSRINNVQKDLLVLDILNERIMLDNEGLYFGIEMLGYFNESGNAIEKDSYVRPAMTGKMHKDLIVLSYLHNIFEDDALTPVADYIRMGGMEVGSRNLAIGITLR